MQLNFPYLKEKRVAELSEAPYPCNAKGYLRYAVLKSTLQDRHILKPEKLSLVIESELDTGTVQNTKEFFVHLDFFFGGNRRSTWDNLLTFDIQSSACS